MATVEADFDLYLCTQGGETTDGYGGSVGMYTSVFKKYFAPLEERELEKTGNKLNKLTPAELNVVKEAATVAAKEAAPREYMVRLFLLLTDDKRYGPLKTYLDTNFLMGE